MKTKRTIKPVYITIIAVTIVCLCAPCFAAALGSNYLSKTGFLGMRVCAGFTTSPRFQVGITWVSPLSSYLPPLTLSPAAVCTNLPFNPSTMKLFGLHGEFMFPP